jgi:hypothetical protein
MFALGLVAALCKMLGHEEGVSVKQEDILAGVQKEVSFDNSPGTMEVVLKIKSKEGSDGPKETLPNDGDAQGGDGTGSSTDGSEGGERADRPDADTLSGGSTDGGNADHGEVHAGTTLEAPDGTSTS